MRNVDRAVIGSMLQVSSAHSTMSQASTISNFFRHTLGAGLKNTRSSWGAINPTTNQLFLRVWQDHLENIDGEQRVLIMGSDWAGPGKRERQQHLEALRRGVEGYGILCTAKDIQNPRRKIESFNRDTLLRFGDLIDVDALVYASVVGHVALDDLSIPAAHVEGAGWTQVEVEECVDAYLEMLSAEQRGEEYSKLSYNSRLREGPLAARTRGSIEYRMQNISAVLEDLGLSRILGYLPAKNVGRNVRSQIMTILGSRGYIVDPRDYEETSDEAELEERTRKLRARGFATPPKGSRTPGTASGSQTTFLRDPAVRAWVLDAAAGVCELCRSKAPFVDSHNEPFLEVHHVVPLGENGPDTTDNAVAVCPNCHRRCHYANDSCTAREELYEQVSRLDPP